VLLPLTLTAFLQAVINNYLNLNNI